MGAKRTTAKKATRSSTRARAAAKAGAAARKAAATGGPSDAAVEAKTGRDWRGWFELLDARGGARLDHKGIVALLAEEPGISPWWQQTVAVGYERARGLRDKHEAPDGYQVSATRTVDGPPEAVFALLASERDRRGLFGPGALKVSTSTEPKSLRGAWSGGGRVDVLLTPRSGGRTAVSVQHRRLRAAADVAALKAHWTAALERLGTRLAPKPTPGRQRAGAAKASR
ncbi:MAG: hypothetical protein ACK4N5_08470 [Myxococcales bacterium]